MKRVITIIILILVTIGIIWTINWHLSVTQTNTNMQQITIGAILPLTGAGAGVGETIRQGLEWKIEELNNQGKNIKLIIEDSQSDPKQALAAYQNLVQVKKVNIVFSTLSSTTLPLKPLAEQDHVLLWADISHPEITLNSNYILRHSNTAEKDAEVMANHLITQPIKSVGILYQQDAWALAFKEALRKRLLQSDIKIYEEAIDNKQSDFKTEIIKLKEKNPDALLVFTVGPAAGHTVKQIRQLNYKGLIYSGVGFVLTPDAQAIAGQDLDGMFYETYPQNDNFTNDYKIRFNKAPTLIGFMSYTDIEILMNAIEKTNSTNPETIISFIKNQKEFQGKYEKVEIQNNGDMIIPMIMDVWKATK